MVKTNEMFKCLMVRGVENGPYVFYSGFEGLAWRMVGLLKQLIGFAFFLFFLSF